MEDQPPLEAILRPSAIVPAAAAVRIVAALEELDVSRGGLWNATTSLWQRYDRPWSNMGKGSAELVGSIAVVYDQPLRNEITIYKVNISESAAKAGWTTETLCDDALQHARLTLATCPRAALQQPPTRDPFKRRRD